MKFEYYIWGNLHMIYILLGFVAFLFFVIYDINSIIFKHKILNGCFFVGVFLITFATVGIIITTRDLIMIDFIGMGILGMLAVIFFYLLIYTLFFALPFKNTYIETEGSPKVYKNGVYALCRHPGVLWFTGFYIFLGLALKIPLLLTAAVIFSLLNILYVVFQDQWTFIKVFDNYDKYKKDTPFLFPSLKSIKCCLQFYRRTGGRRDEI